MEARRKAKSHGCHGFGTFRTTATRGCSMDGMGGVGVDEGEAEDKAEGEAAVAAASPAAAESGEAEAEDVVFSAERLEVERKRRRIMEGG